MDNYVIPANSAKTNLWFECFVCHQKYTHRTNLRRHIRAAHDKKRYHCHHCNGEFKRKEYLRRHLEKCHPSPSTASTSEAPTLLSSIACQTKRGGLRRTCKLSHQGSNTDSIRTVDKKIGSPIQLVDRATSPVQWGNLNRPTSQATPPVESYSTATGNFWETKTVDNLVVISHKDESPLPEDLQNIPLHEKDFFMGLNSLNLDFQCLM